MPNTPAFSLIDAEDGRRLHYLLEGPEDAPFVLYDAGAFGIYADGWWVKEALKAHFRVCLYDRAGMGASDPVPAGTVPTPQWHVEDMRRLLAALGVTEKVICIGHSMSGLRMHAFASLYPDDIKGMVLVDALSPRGRHDALNKFAADQFGRILKAGAFGAKIGLAEPVSRLAPNNFRLEGVMRENKTWSYGAPSHHEAARDEVLAVDFDQNYLSGDGITHIPLAVFAATSINGMRETDTDAARENAGYGWFGRFPREDHVSLLRGVYAEAIARRADEIEQHFQSRN